MPFLDTTVLIDLGRKPGNAYRAAAVAALSRLNGAGEENVTSLFNVAELLVGVELADDPIAERRRVDEVLEDVTILELEESAALRYAKYASHLRRIGRLVGTVDVFVASVAGGSGMVLLTRNPRHFQNIPGLMIEAY